MIIDLKELERELNNDNITGDNREMILNYTKAANRIIEEKSQGDVVYSAIWEGIGVHFSNAIERTGKGSTILRDYQFLLYRYINASDIYAINETIKNYNNYIKEALQKLNSKEKRIYLVCKKAIEEYARNNNVKGSYGNIHLFLESYKKMRETMETAIKPFFEENGVKLEATMLKKIIFYLGDIMDLAFYK